MTALLEYLDLPVQVAESGQANAGLAGPWAPALVSNLFEGYLYLVDHGATDCGSTDHMIQCLEVQKYNMTKRHCIQKTHLLVC